MITMSTKSTNMMCSTGLIILKLRYAKKIIEHDVLHVFSSVVSSQEALYK
jgi:hypothetical protein